MKIIIPMTGYGSRFVAAGYKNLKPLINVQGMPIIEWIVKGMYPGEDNFLFICREDHLNNIPKLKETLERIAPNGTIFSISDWEKKGPVNDVIRASTMIDDKEPCIVNYCDFYQKWDYKYFCEEVKKIRCGGAIPCYSGFHPHLIHEKNVYASCLVDDNDNLIEIREKYSFNMDKTKAKHSPGVYYYQNGSILKYYYLEQIEKGQVLNGEHYSSLPYNFMVKDGLKVWVPNNVDFFCQWGTPNDLEEYLFWTELTRRYKL